MNEKQMRASLEELRSDLARYGARLGIVEPILRGVLNEVPRLEAVILELRARKDYELADKLRDVVIKMNEAKGWTGNR